MPILNQQTGTAQEYEVIRFVTGTSTLHFSITNISEKCVRDKNRSNKRQRTAVFVQNVVLFLD